MKKLNSTLYLFFFLLVTFLTTDAGLSPRIFHGHNIPITVAPFQVRVKSTSYCGGVIIGPRYVLTAAHCFKYKNATFLPERKYTVEAGITNLAKATESDAHQIESVVNAINGDIAVVVLAKELEFSARIQPAKLPAREPEAGEAVLISGWGRTDQGKRYDLMAVDATIGEKSKCKFDEGIMKRPATICIKSKQNGLGICHGDSGGPAFSADGTVYGISSYIWEKCNYTGNDWRGYGYFVNVYHFRDFIKDVTGL